MNIDLINGGPHWTWVIKLSGSVFGLVILVWLLLKLIPVCVPIPITSYPNVSLIVRFMVLAD